jgi:hypothetical protein
MPAWFFGLLGAFALGTRSGRAITLGLITMSFLHVALSPLGLPIVDMNAPVTKFQYLPLFLWFLFAWIYWRILP